MKLELKHLAPYLPYELEFMRYEKNCINRDVVPVVYADDLQPVKTNLNEVTLNGFNYNLSKPILKPLADLENDEYEYRIFNREYIIDKEADAELGYYEWCYLFENHFDVFGLIQEGLAIDINKLEN